MKINRITKIATASVILTAVGFAHHIEVALSHVFGAKILDNVVFFTGEGVPSYRHSESLFPHHQTFDLDHGDSFTVRDGAGVSETIVFESSDFVGTMGGSIDNAHLHDVLEVINTKSTLLETTHDNEAVVFRGTAGGEARSLELIDGPGAPLSQLNVPTAMTFGMDDVRLELSIPSSLGEDLAGHNYWVFASLTDGSTAVQGQPLPLGVDPLMSLVAERAMQGSLPGLIGQLDEDNDASVLVRGRWLRRVGAQTQLYFAYVVFSPDWSTVEFVSDRFTVDFQ